MSSRESLNHGYFYDALSGMFWPPSDPMGRGHTLGRLLNGTIEKGEIAGAHSHTETHRYSPSWAPVESVVTISHWDIRSLAISGLGRTLELVHTLDGKPNRSLLVIDSGISYDPIINAQLGYESDYAAIQDDVKQAAQEFFNTFTSAE